MATHSSVLAWRIPWVEELGGLQSMGSQRVGHYWATKHQVSTPRCSLLPTSLAVTSADCDPAPLLLASVGLAHGGHRRGLEGGRGHCLPDPSTLQHLSSGSPRPGALPPKRHLSRASDPTGPWQRSILPHLFGSWGAKVFLLLTILGCPVAPVSYLQAP